MRLIVKSDDYGFTKGVTAGSLDGIENGIITCTGLFTNMPSSEYAAKQMIRRFPQFCLGNEINIVSGRPVSDPSKIPHLVDPNTGEFVRSTLRYHEAKVNRVDFWPYEECVVEVRAQVERFYKMTGKLPCYLSGHSITMVSPNFFRALDDVSREIGVPFSQNLEKELQIKRVRSWSDKPFELSDQIDRDVETHVLNQLEAMKDEALVMISGHCGFLDAELLKYSSFTVIRAKDHEMYTSEKLKRWIAENHVELTTLTGEIVDRKMEAAV